MAATALAFFGHFVFGRLPVSSDMSLMYAPFYSLRWDGGLPLWNPYVAGGMPMDGNLQFSAVYPLRFPFYFLGDWQTGFSLFMLAHYLVAMVGMAGMLRSMGTSRLAAFVGAVCFACGGYMVGRIINTTIFIASCWFPWLVWGAVARGAVGGLIATVAVAMTIWTGSPHLIVYGSIGFGLAWLAMTPFRFRDEEEEETPEPKPPPELHLFRWVYYALGVGAGLVSLVPGLMLVRQSVRTETDIANNLQDSLRWSEIPFAFLGGAGGAIYPEINDKCVYVAGAGLILIAVGCARAKSWRDRRWWCAIVLTFAGLILALGSAIGWQFVLPYLPGLNLLEGPARALVLTSCGLSMLIALGLDRLTDAPRRTRLIVAALCVLLAAIGSGLLSGHLPPEERFADLLFGWLTVPGSVIGRSFTAVNLPLVVIPAAILLVVWPTKSRGLGLAMTALLVAQLGHFAPRVAPVTVTRDYFEPTPTVQFLTDRAATEPPFRIVGYNALQFHDTEWDNLHKIDFLTPNFFTLYGLEDIRGFDPLIGRQYRNLISETSGQAPYNDPIRNLDLGAPHLDLFDSLNVRYLIGNPFDRRLTHLPQTMTPNQPVAPIAAWEEAGESRPIEAWRFVSLVDTSAPLAIGETIARLHVEADEGTFDFPVRYGHETGPIYALEGEESSFTAIKNMRWKLYTGFRDLGYRIEQANYQATLDFGRPLHVRRAQWRLARKDVVFFVASQAYRLAPPNGGPDLALDGALGRAPEEAPDWKLVFEDPVAPVYEYTRAAPRASFLTNYRIAGNEVSVADFKGAPSEIRRVEKSLNGAAWEVEFSEPGLLFLRDVWAPGWKARIDGAEAPVLRVNGLLRAVEVPTGSHSVKLRYRPTTFYIFLAVSVCSLALAFAIFRKQRRRKETLPAETESVTDADVETNPNADA